MVEFGLEKSKISLGTTKWNFLSAKNYICHGHLEPDLPLKKIDLLGAKLKTNVSQVKSYLSEFSKCEFLHIPTGTNCHFTAIFLYL